MNTLALLLLLASQSGLRSTTLCTGSNPADCLPPPPICGNGIVHRIEACDDGNRTAGDGCSFMCSLEAGYACTGSPSSCGPDCGDSLIIGLETCDDGNETAADGCSDSCAVESGWYCTGLPSACTTTCGDGSKAGTEECDDGNLVDGDGCSATCTTEAPDYVVLLHNSFDGTASPFVNEGALGGYFSGGASDASGMSGRSVSTNNNPSWAQAYTAGNAELDPLKSVSTGSFTVGYWVYLPSVAGQTTWGKMLNITDPDEVVFTFVEPHYTGHWYAFVKMASGNCGVGYTGTTYDLAPSVWHNFELTYDTEVDTVSVKLDGVTVGSTVCGLGALALSSDTRIKLSWPTYNQGTIGEFDEVYVTDGVYTAACGDGIITWGETCDDSNTADGDGCSSTCTVEVEPIGYWSGFSASNYFATPNVSDLFDATEADNTWMRCIAFATTTNTVPAAQNIAGDGGWGGGDGTVFARFGSADYRITFRNTGVVAFYETPAISAISVACYGETGTTIVGDASWDAPAMTSSSGTNTDAPNYTFKVGGPNDSYGAFSSGVIYAIAMYSTSATSGAIAAGIADGADGRFDNTTNATVICNGQQFQTGCEIGGAVFSKTGSPTFTAL